MAPVTHAFVSAVADAGDPDEVGPDEWNADHDMGLLASIACSEQCLLQANAATTNTQDSGLVGDTNGAFGGKNLMRFPLSGVPAEIKRAWLRFVMLDNANCLGANEGINAWLRLDRIMRTDLNYSQATWNIYKTGSNWTAGGAGSGGNDYDTDHVFWYGPFSNQTRLFVGNGAMVQYFELEVTALLNDALAQSLTNLDLDLYATALSGHNKLTIASRTNGTTAYRPTVFYEE